jgi:hypothetical protein
MKIKKACKIIGIFLTILSASFFYRQMTDNLQDFLYVTPLRNSLPTILISVCLAVFSISLGGLIWHVLLKDRNILISVARSQNIYLVAQFGKYLPGNMGHHVGRVMLSRKEGIPATITIQTMLIEILWGLGIAAGLALFSISFFLESDLINHLSFIGRFELLLLLLIVVMALPWFFVYMLNKFTPELSKKLSNGEILTLPRIHTATAVALLFVACFFALGMILDLQARFIFNHADSNLIQLSCLYSIAWIAGYLMPGAPAGLGVREAVMVLILTPIYGNSIAVGLSISLRLTTTLGDAVSFCLGLVGNTLSTKHN